MKKILFILCLLSVFIACEDNNDKTPDSPIQNLQMPSAETPIAAGQTVTLQGQGFTSTSQIWLRVIQTKAEGDIQTEITEVNDNLITFRTPDNISGEKDVILKQNGKEYRLGKLKFNIIDKNLFVYKVIFKNENDNNDIKQIVKIDRNTGTEQVIANLNIKADYLENIVYIPSTKEIIGIDDNDDNLVKINIVNATSQIVKLQARANYSAITIDESENLYAYIVTFKSENDNNDIKQIVKIDRNTGTEQVIANLNIKADYLENIIYIPSTKEIIGIDDNDDNLVKINIVNATSQIVKLQARANYSALAID